MEYANYNFCSPEECGISPGLLHYLASRCGFSVMTRRREGKIQYKLKRERIPCEKLYSRKDSRFLNYIDLADLHIGNCRCEIDRIKETLRYAARHNVNYVFIAGDLLDGVYDITSQDVKEVYERQIDLAYSIFRKFPLDIRVIPGNHEFTFDLSGFINPLRVLEEQLQSEECFFKVYDGYIQDFEMAGIVKRMMHLENYYRQGNEFSAVHRLYEFHERGGLQVKCQDGMKKPLRFLHCGHIHKRVELYDSDYNVYITQPGAFICEQNFRNPYIHVQGEVLDDLRIVRG